MIFPALFRPEGMNDHNPSTARLWTGRVMTAFVVLFLLFDAGWKLFGTIPPDSKDLLGYPLHTMPLLAVILLTCTALHLVPRTALLGAILLTGYLGGAIASHVRVENPLATHTLFPIYVAALIWGGLLLRRPEVRLLLGGAAPGVRLPSTAAAQPVGHS